MSMKNSVDPPPPAHTFTVRSPASSTRFPVAGLAGGLQRQPAGAVGPQGDVADGVAAHCWAVDVGQAVNRDGPYARVAGDDATYTGASGAIHGAQHADADGLAGVAGDGCRCGR